MNIGTSILGSSVDGNGLENFPGTIDNLDSNINASLDSSSVTNVTS